MPIHVRLGVVAYAAFFLVAGQPFNAYWGWMCGPLLALWTAFAPQGIARVFASRGAGGYDRGTQAVV
jgi:hypothetical protein